MSDRAHHSMDFDNSMIHGGPFVSVIIPCYNKAQFLGDAVQSALDQTYRHCEIIIVDDGSLDASRDVAESFSQAKYIRQDNQGPSGARNTGLRFSKGEYLVFLDADDRLLPQAIEIGLRCLDSHPDCAFVSGHVRIIGKDGSAIRTPEESCIRNDHYLTLLCYNYIWTPGAVLFRKNAVENVNGFSLTRFGTEDWDIYLRISRMAPVFCHDAIVAEYRMYDEQLSSDCRYMLKESLECLKEQKVFLKGEPKRQEAYRKGVIEIQKYFGEPLMQQIHSSLRSHRWITALKGAFTLMRYYPLRFVSHVS